MAFILMYHRISEEATDIERRYALCVSPVHFAEHLEVLKQFRVMPLRTLTLSSPASVAITFDDGYAENFYWTVVRQSLPATLFPITGDPVGSRNTQNRPPNDFTVHRRLSLDEVKWLAATGVFEIGAHTETHPFLPDLNTSEQLTEIGNSKLRLEELLGEAVTSFAYPYGALNAETSGILSMLGFHRAVAVRDRAARASDDPFLLPRIHVRDWSGDELLKRLQ